MRGSTWAGVGGVRTWPWVEWSEGEGATAVRVTGPTKVERTGWLPVSAAVVLEGDGIARGGSAPAELSRGGMGPYIGYANEFNSRNVVGSAERRGSAAALSSFGMISAPGRESWTPRARARGFVGGGSETAHRMIPAGVVRLAEPSRVVHREWKGGDKPLHPL